jgi:hypothetical protein
MATLFLVLTLKGEIFAAYQAAINFSEDGGIYNHWYIRSNGVQVSGRR